MDGDGTNARQLASGGGPYSWPEFSPDASKVAFPNSEGRPEIVDVTTGEVTTLEEFSDEPVWYGNDMLIV
jgi:Tol biopolymer transport system component